MVSHSLNDIRSSFVLNLICALLFPMPSTKMPLKMNTRMMQRQRTNARTKKKNWNRKQLISRLKCLQHMYSFLVGRRNTTMTLDKKRRHQQRRVKQTNARKQNTGKKQLWRFISHKQQNKWHCLLPVLNANFQNEWQTINAKSRRYKIIAIVYSALFHSSTKR